MEREIFQGSIHERLFSLSLKVFILLKVLKHMWRTALMIICFLNQTYFLTCSSPYSSLELVTFYQFFTHKASIIGYECLYIYFPTLEWFSAVNSFSNHSFLKLSYPDLWNIPLKLMLCWFRRFFCFKPSTLNDLYDAKGNLLEQAYVNTAKMNEMIADLQNMEDYHFSQVLYSIEAQKC